MLVWSGPWPGWRRRSRAFFSTAGCADSVPGVHIPDHVIQRLEGAKSQKREGRLLCVGLLQAVREIEGVSGVHVMAYRQEEAVAEIIQTSGVLDGRVPWYPTRDQKIDNRRAS